MIKNLRQYRKKRQPHDCDILKSEDDPKPENKIIKNDQGCKI